MQDIFNLVLADAIRPESYEAIKILHANGIKSILLTGDNTTVAKSVSDELKMDGFFAEAYTSLYLWCISLG